MYKKIISTTILFVILFTSMFVYASSNLIEIEYSTKHTLIQRDKTKLYLELDKPLEFRVNEETFIFPKDKSEVLKSFSIEFIEGKKTTDDLKTTIENGLILIETNLGDILLDNEGIFFHNEKAYKIGEKLEVKEDYKLKFKEEFKRLVEIKNSNENMDSKLTNLEYEIKELKKEILEKEANQSKDQDFHKEELELQIKALEKELVAERNKKPNVSSSGSPSYSEQTVQPNIYRPKGSLQIIGEVPKSFEDLKQDIFLELARGDSAGDHEIFYLSGNNGFKNTNQLEVGDYFVKSIYFLDSSLKDKYEFHHNNMVKVLDNETTYFNLSLTETDPVLENLLFEEDREDDLDILEASLEEDPIKMEAKKNKSKKSLFIFIISILAISGVLIWKFDLINKIIYKE